MIVVKVGGSLFDHPNLGFGLRAFLRSLTPSRVLLVPGGGAVAEAVRQSRPDIMRWVKMHRTGWHYGGWM